jgi:2-dehydro-3-deoxyphosphooctonate aldolase (KDO 8-P synthase)
MAPWDLADVVAKLREFGNDQIMLYERGACFGYDAIVSDMRAGGHERDGLPGGIRRHPVRAAARRLRRRRRSTEPRLARAAVAVGVAGILLETHPDARQGPQRRPNIWPLDRREELFTVLLKPEGVVKRKR